MKTPEFTVRAASHGHALVLWERNGADAYARDTIVRTIERRLNTPHNSAGELLAAAKQASQFVAKLSAEGNVFARRMLRRLEAAIEKEERGDG